MQRQSSDSGIVLGDPQERDFEALCNVVAKHFKKDMPKSKNEMRCAHCGKLLAEEVSISEGFVSITCSCGVTNLVTTSKEKVEKAPEREKREYRGLPR
jgi:phage FluMu protein Com